MKIYLRSNNIDPLLYFNAGGRLQGPMMDYLESLNVPLHEVPAFQEISESSGGALVFPVSIDTIPHTVQLIELLRTGVKDLPRIIIATDLYLPGHIIELMKQCGVEGIIDLFEGGRFTYFTPRNHHNRDRFENLYRELLVLIDNYLKGNLSLLFSHNTICNAVVNTSPILICVTDMAGRIIFFNMKEKNLKKYAVNIEEVYGKNIRDFTAHADTIESLYRDISDSNDVCTSEIVISHNNSSYNLSVTAKKMSMYTTDVVLLVGVNITRQRKTEELLAESEIKYRLLVENSSEGICLIKGEAIVYANPRFMKIFGIDQNSEIHHILLRDLITEDDNNIVEAILSRGSDVLPKTLEVRGRRINSDIVDIELAISCFTMDNENFFQIIVRDITETKKIWQNILQYERLSAIGELVSGISHEFNNIITSIRGYIQYALTTEQEPEEMRGTLNIIDGLTEHGANIIKKISMFSKQEIENREYCRLGDVIEDMLSIQEKIFFQESITLKKEYISNPGVCIDRALMQQVFLNILVNAVHAIRPIGKGTVTITIDSQHSDAVIRFHDTGAGIDPSIGDDIFTPFFTTKKGRNNDVLGTGMGLPISKNIVEQHNGTISFTSTPGSGTEFTIRLPLQETPESLPQRGHETDVEEQDISSLRVLVTDDNTGVRELLKNILATLGVRDIAMAVNGKEALGMAAAETYDIIFMDVSMPVMSGTEAFRMIRKEKPEQRIVFITGLFQEGHIKDQVDNESAYGYITKPFDIMEIKKIIKSIAFTAR
ncbi:MAG TPA: response regulator [Spirochaetota bacterium]|nr:response regulator [Spirochaetota bacterium]